MNESKKVQNEKPDWTGFIFVCADALTNHDEGYLISNRLGFLE